MKSFTGSSTAMRRGATSFRCSRMQSSRIEKSIHESDFATPMRSAKRRKPSGVKPRRRAPTSVGMRGSSQPSTCFSSTSWINFRLDNTTYVRLSRANSICCGSGRCRRPGLFTYVVLSKRKLIQLVEEKHVEGWDDPRMPTLVGARRRGFTPEGFRLFAERIGVAKSDSWIDFSILEDCMREHLNEVAPRRIAVLDPVKLVIENYPPAKEEECEAPNHPQKPEWGRRKLRLSRELWIEREDFSETPPKGYFRLFPGNRVRLRNGYIVECIGYDKTTDTVRCTYDPDTRSGTPGAEKVKVKGNIHWVSAKDSFAAEVRLYDRLFKVPHPGAGDSELVPTLNPDSKKLVTAQLEPALKDAAPEERFQFERHGYFTADRVDSRPGAPKFNRAVTLRDSWGKSASP